MNHVPFIVTTFEIRLTQAKFFMLFRCIRETGLAADESVVLGSNPAKVNHCECSSPL